MNIKKIIRGKAGFTLIELMIVVIIIGILAAAAVPIYRANMRKAYATEGLATLDLIRGAERLYKVEWNTYLAVTAGTGPTTGGIYKSLGLDTSDNKYWNNPAFKVEAGTAGIATSFTATATGDNSSAPAAARVAGILMTMNEKGTITGP
jgi:prepilin-type N-terminal cleavage/methylation domain-containing protein